MNTTERIYDVMFCAKANWFSASELSKILDEDIRFVRNALAKEHKSGNLITRENEKGGSKLGGKRGFEYRLSPSNMGKKIADFWTERGFEKRIGLSQKVFGDISITYLKNAKKGLSLFAFETKSMVYIIPPDRRTSPLFSYFLETISDAYTSKEGESGKEVHHKGLSLSSEIKIKTPYLFKEIYLINYNKEKREGDLIFLGGPAGTPSHTSLDEVFFELLSSDGVSDFFLELLSPEFREKVNSLSDGKRKTLSEALLKVASVFRGLPLSPSSDGGSALSPSSDSVTPTASPSGGLSPSSGGDSVSFPDSVTPTAPPSSPSSDGGTPPTEPAWLLKVREERESLRLTGHRPRKSDDVPVDPARKAHREAARKHETKKASAAMKRLEAEADKNLHPRYWDMRETPAERDYLFAYAYCVLVEWHFAGFSESAWKMCPLQRNKFRQGRYWKYFHKGRCLADEAGMRYEDYIDGVFEYWSSQSRPPKAPKVPIPNTCFGEELGLTGALCFQCTALKNSVTITLDDFEFSQTLDEKLAPKLFDPATMEEADYNQALILYQDRIFQELERVALSGQFGLLDLVSASIDYGILPQTWAEGYGLHHNLKALEKYRFTPPPAHFNYETLFQIVKQRKRF